MSVSTVKYCKSTTKTYIITPTYTSGFIFECSIHCRLYNMFAYNFYETPTYQ